MNVGADAGTVGNREGARTADQPARAENIHPVIKDIHRVRLHKEVIINHEYAGGGHGADGVCLRHITAGATRHRRGKVVGGDVQMTQVGRVHPAPVFKQKIALAGGTYQGQRQVGNARMVQHHADGGGGNRPVVHNRDGRVTHRVVRNRRPARGTKIKRHHGGQADGQRDLITHVCGRRIGVADGEEQQARLQRRQVGQTDGEASAAAGDGRGVVKRGRGRQCAVADIELNRDRIADADLNTAPIEWNIYKVILQPLGSNGHTVDQHHAIGGPRRQSVLRMRIYVDGQCLHASGVGQRIVHHDERPLAADGIADVASQTSGAVGFSGCRIGVGPGIFIDRRLPHQTIAKGMIVQHDRLRAVVGDGADEVAEIFVRDGVGYRHAPHPGIVPARHRIRGDRHRSRQSRAAIGDDGRCGKAREGVVAVVKREQAEEHRQSILRRLVILGLDADVIDLVLRGVA